MGAAQHVTPPIVGAAIRVGGLVQGVGFRPTVWRLARNCGISGEVWNDAEGVMIRAWGLPAALDSLLRLLREAAPPLARVDAIEVEPIEGSPGRSSFRIVRSQRGDVRTAIVPDAAICDACLAETFDPAGRRYRYPFTNCTHCGPRLSIARSIPYDRANTSMAGFRLCVDCQAE
jgi:hydrogenase maturation protein HypF